MKLNRKFITTNYETEFSGPEPLSDQKALKKLRRKSKSKTLKLDDHILNQLSFKQKMFILEYVKDYNGTQAAIRAGYTPEAAHVQASRFLGQPKIQDALAEYEKGLATRFVSTKERVLKEMSLIAYSDVADYFDKKGPLKIKEFDKLPPQVTRCIKKLKIKTSTKKVMGGPKEARVVIAEYVDQDIDFELYDKKSALDQMGKQLGMFSDKVMHGGHDGGPIKFLVEYEDKPLQDEEEC